MKSCWAISNRLGCIIKIMEKSLDKTKELVFKCTCGCKAQLMLNYVDKGVLTLDTRSDGRKRWIGVALKKKEIKKLKEFIQVIDKKEKMRYKESDRVDADPQEV